MSPVESDDDARLLVAAAAGDERAFEAFYRRYLGSVIGYHLRRAGGRELAFDLAAETFAAVAESLDRFDPARGSAVGWLFGIASNKLLMARRTGRVEDEARRRLGHEPIVLEDADLSRVNELASANDEARLSQLLERLPADQREAILARVVDERSYSDIASQLQCSEAVVRQRVRRGLGFLRTRLEGTR
jgi:RNA polymerase sigma factor (sigma-70 family)